MRRYLVVANQTLGADELVGMFWARRDRAMRQISPGIMNLRTTISPPESGGVARSAGVVPRLPYFKLSA